MKNSKAQLWDMVQFIFRNYYDRMIHTVLWFDGQLDENAVRLAVKHIVDRAEVLKSTFKPGFFRPKWVVNENYDESQLVKVVETDDVVNTAYQCLAQSFSYREKLQLKVFIVTDGTKSALAFLVNHMCFDGGDFGYFLTKFFECYNSVKQNGNCDDVEIKTGSRDADQLYENMTPERAKEAKGLYKNVSRTGIKHKFAFSDDKQNLTTRFTVKKLSQEQLDSIKVKAKSADASLNDILLAGYLRAIAKQLSLSQDEPVNVTSMVDLRRHLPDRQTKGMTNLTGFMPCKIQGVGEDFATTLQRVTEQTKAAKSDPNLGLYGLPLLKLAFTIFPYAIAEAAIRIGYVNPLIGMSNIGTVDPIKYKLDGLNLTDAFMTGATKYKPYVQVTFNGFAGEGRLCIAQKCSEKDQKIISDFLDDMISQMLEFAQK
ncbi:MAG: condensation domain-containing protein [Christensenellales bacterium]